MFLDEVWGCQNHPKYHNSKPFLVGGYLWVPNYGIKVVFKQSAVRNSLLHQCKLTESNGYILPPHHIVHPHLHSSDLAVSICPLLQRAWQVENVTHSRKLYSTFTSASRHPHQTFAPHVNVILITSSMSQYAVNVWGGDAAHPAGGGPTQDTSTMQRQRNSSRRLRNLLVTALRFKLLFFFTYM